jgi:hypothetical protein
MSERGEKRRKINVCIRTLYLGKKRERERKEKNPF